MAGRMSSDNDRFDRFDSREMRGNKIMRDFEGKGNFG